jgi:hypothetical protein
MSLGDQLHRNQKHGANAANHAHQPSTRHAKAASVSVHEDAGHAREEKVRTGIVSVHGRDVGEMRCTGGRRDT